MFWLLLLPVLLAPEGLTDPPLEPAGSFVVIVHATHEGNAIRRGELGEIFLGRATRWGDNRGIESVDQSLRSPVREQFCRKVLQLEPGALLQYWQAQLQNGTGRRPPSVKGNDADVAEWVAQKPGRIGYVGSGALLSPSVKPVSIIE